MPRKDAAKQKKPRKGWSEKTLLKYLRLYLSENEINEDESVGSVIERIKNSIIDSL